MIKIKNRIIISIMCIVLAGLAFFTGIQIVASNNKTTFIVQVKSNIRKGDIIDEEKVTIREIGGHNIPSSYLKDTNEVIGKYALTDLVPNDFIQSTKIADKLPTVEEKLLKLDGTRIALSINLNDFSRGLSDKVITGDIVSCLVTQESGTEIPQELTYVEVLTTTMPSGNDKENSGDVEEENLATATLLVTPHQAKLLSEYDKKAEIHLALVYRGDEKIAKEFLDKQAEALDTLVAEPSEQTEIPTDTVQEAA